MSKRKEKFDNLDVKELEDFLMDSGIILNPEMELNDHLTLDDLAESYNELRCALQLLLVGEHLTREKFKTAMELAQSLKKT